MRKLLFFLLILILPAGVLGIAQASEEVMDVECPKGIDIIVYPTFTSNVTKGFDSNHIYAVVTDEFMESTGKVDPIFPQLLEATWQSCPKGTHQIISSFLVFRYLNINPVKLSAELRYTFPLNSLTPDPDSRYTIEPLPESLVAVTCSRLNQVEYDHGKDTLRRLLYSMKYGIASAVKRVLDIDFVTFVRSLRYELQTENKFISIEPSGNIKQSLKRISQLRDKVWSDLPHIRSTNDVGIRLSPESSFRLALIEMAMEKPESTIKSTLERVNQFFDSRDRVLKRWWVFTGIATFILILLMAMSILSGLKYKDSLA